MTHDDWLKKTEDYWKGAFDMIPDDLGDGVWVQMHHDIVRDHMVDCCNVMGVSRPPELDAMEIIVHVHAMRQVNPDGTPVLHTA